MDIVKGIQIDDEDVVIDTSKESEILKFAINDYINERMNQISQEK